MNTPAHAIVNLLVLEKKEQPGLFVPVAVGAVLPDLPMFVFYIVHKSRGEPESAIWNQHYFDPAWQQLFDVFNSLPILLVLALLAYRFEWSKSTALLLSMALHSFSDLLLHNDDAHRHFLPLSDWRFRSPVSYWDPNYFGQYVTVMEALVVLVGVWLIWKRYPRWLPRSLVGLIGLAYVGVLAFAVTYWM